jgi:hypothetical protein
MPPSALCVATVRAADRRVAQHPCNLNHKMAVTATLCFRSSSDSAAAAPRIREVQPWPVTDTYRRSFDALLA